MASKILSVEIGNSITRVCEMDFRVKNPKVYKSFCIPTPQGAIEDGFVRENAEFVAAMRRALSANKISTKQVVFSVTSSKIVTRDVTIPSIKINQVGSYIKANANDYFPIDLSMYELAHVLLGTETDDEGKEKMRVMVMAAGKDLIADYARFATECGLRFVSLDYCGNSVYQIMRNECGSETTLVVKIEDTATIATIISSGDLLLQRNIAYGIDRACNAMMDSQEHYVGTYTEAFNTACQKPCIKVALNDRTRIIEKDDVFSETEAESDARLAITKTFSQLIGNLARLVELHNTKAVGGSISQVLLIGIGAEVQNLSKLLTNELGIPTRVVKNLSAASTNSSGMEEFALGRYVGVIGAAIAPVDLTLSDKGKKGKAKINYGKIAVLAGLLCAVVIVVMVVKSLIPYYAAKEVENSLKAQEAQYAEAEPIYNRFVNMSELYLEVINQYRMTEHSNDEIVAFFTELEQKLPSDTVVKEIVSDSESARITFWVPELEQSAKILQILRGFESVMDVALGDGTKDSGDEETGEAGFVFQAICYYYPIELEDNVEDIQFADSQETGGTDEE